VAHTAYESTLNTVADVSSDYTSVRPLLCLSVTRSEYTTCVLTCTDR